jgi:hypothetical protein
MPKVYDSETKERAQPFVLLDANGDQITTFTSSLSSASTSSLSNVVASASSTAILASNASRKGATLVNDSTATLYLKYGATASTTSYSYQVPPGGTWEMATPPYTGAIDGIWSSATGNARVTELT